MKKGHEKYINRFKHFIEKIQTATEKSGGTSENFRTNTGDDVKKSSGLASTASSLCRCHLDSSSSDFYPPKKYSRKRKLSQESVDNVKKVKIEKRQKLFNNKRKKFKKRFDKKYSRHNRDELQSGGIKLDRKGEGRYLEKSDDKYKSNDTTYKKEYNKRLDCLAKYGKNFYCPSICERKGLRPIYIDGSNVAFSHGQNEKFSVKGLKTCIDYFRKRGHKVKAFVPHFRLRKGETTDHQLLHNLVNKKLVITTPTLYIQNQRRSPYDDWYIVQSAAANGGIIISADNFQDIIKWNPNLRSVIEECRLVPTFVDDMIIFPVDPHGNRRNNLEQFLRF